MANIVIIWEIKVEILQKFTRNIKCKHIFQSRLFIIYKLEPYCHCLISVLQPLGLATNKQIYTNQSPGNLTGEARVKEEQIGRVI